MTLKEVEALETVCRNARNLEREINQLTEAIQEGEKAVVIRFDFDNFEIWYRTIGGAKDENLKRVCFSSILEPHKREFKDAFLSIVKRALENRQKQLGQLSK